MRIVVIDKKIQGGEPVLRGTRVTVKTILAYLGNGVSTKDLSSRYKKNGIYITTKDISNALLYASTNMGGNNGN